jgi:hypothetical protein
MNSTAIELENAIKSLEKVSTFNNVVQYPFIAGFLSSAIVNCASKDDQVAAAIIRSIESYISTINQE